MSINQGIIETTANQTTEHHEVDENEDKLGKISAMQNANCIIIEDDSIIVF